jgi:hemolysin III
MLVLYAISSVYHGLSPKLHGKRVMQVLDHCSIFLLIAGTYTPMALCAIRPYNSTLGWVLFGVIWALAALGITFNAIDLKKYATFSMICYLLMGWAIVVRIDLIYRLITPSGFWLLLSGGIAYTVGAALYLVGKKRRYAHTAFHVFTVDFRPLFLDAAGSARRELYLDGLHPNREGHRLMAQLLCRRLEELEGGL